MKINRIIGFKIKELRLQKGIKAEIMAHSLGISKGAFSFLENGKTEITISRLILLSDLLNCEINYFFIDIKIR